VPLEPDAATALRTAGAHPGPIRLTVTDHELIEFRKPVFRGDSILQRAEYPRLAALAVPAYAVTRVEEHRFSARKTILALGVAALAFPVLYAAYYGTCGCYDQ
jgi:hypothetical protein